MQNIDGSDLTTSPSQSRSVSKRPRRAALALVASVAFLAFNTSCLAPPRRSQALACPCFPADPLDRVAGVVSAHRLSDDADLFDSESDAL